MTQLLICFTIRFTQSEIVLLSNLQNRGEEDKECSREWLLNTDLQSTRHAVYHLITIVCLAETIVKKKADLILHLFKSYHMQPCLHGI